MKILFLPGEYPFCYYYRGYLPGVYSNQMVVKDFLTIRRGSPAKNIIEQVKRADVVVLQRPKDEKTLKLVHTIKSMGKKVIFENDDTYLVGKGIPLEILETDKQREIVKYFDFHIKEILKLADGAIASTPILAEEYSVINQNVAVLKNTIDPLDEFPVKQNTTGKFRVGIIGSVTTNDDYVHISEQIRQLDERGDVTLVVLGVKYKDGSHIKYMQKDYDFWASLKNVEWHPYVNVTEYMSTIADLALDLAIIPRKESYFNECKSNLKFLEMSLLHIPVIAQGFQSKKGPYDGVDSEYMTVIYDNSLWYDEIIKVKDNYFAYKNLAHKAHDYVLKNYNIATYANEWLETIGRLVANK